MSLEMVLGGYSPKGRKVYLGHVRRFLQRTGGLPVAEMDQKVIARYLHQQIEGRGISRATHAQILSSLRFFTRASIPTSRGSSPAVDPEPI